MKKSSLIKCFCVFILIFLNAEILASSSTYKIDKKISLDFEEIDHFDKLAIIKHFNKYNASKITPVDWESYYQYSLDQLGDILKNLRQKYIDTDELSSKITSIVSRSDLMDSAWPMYCHDTRHTGRSPYSTIDTWDEIMRFNTDDYVRGSPVVGNDGIIYFGAANDFYALYPNGTIKWVYYIPGGWIETCPCIDKNGTIYAATMHTGLRAINSNGTLKWVYSTPDTLFSSPVVDEDGTVYFGDSENWQIKAINPNGTLKWSFKTGLVVYSSPTIGSDGIVYCGSHDTYLYALYPNNGTLKWKYKTGDWIRVSPCIADDSTIYIVSLDGYLHAVNPDGSFKWKTDVGAGTSPTIGQDGTIYAGYRVLYAINPVNGSVKWTFDVGGTMQGSTPCHSAEDIIYFGTHFTDYDGGGEFVAVNPDGTLRWRQVIANHYVDSAPAIGHDGRVYVGSAWEINGYSHGYLHVFGIGPLEANADGPYYGLINHSVQFKDSSSGGYSPHSYYWDFGDSYSSNEQNPTHTYTNADNYTVTLTVTDNTSNTSTDTTWAWVQTTNTQPNKPTITGPTKGKPGTSYTYTFVTTDIDGTEISYYIDWGDESNTGWKGPYSSGKQISLSHTWDYKGTYTIKCKAKDPYNAESDWATLEITMPRSKLATSSLLLKFLERFPILQNLLIKFISFS